MRRAVREADQRNHKMLLERQHGTCRARLHRVSTRYAGTHLLHSRALAHLHQLLIHDHLRSQFPDGNLNCLRHQVSGCSLKSYSHGLLVLSLSDSSRAPTSQAGNWYIWCGNILEAFLDSLALCSLLFELLLHSRRLSIPAPLQHDEHHILFCKSTLRGCHWKRGTARIGGGIGSEWGEPPPRVTSQHAPPTPAPQQQAGHEASAWQSRAHPQLAAPPSPPTRPWRP